MTTRGVAAAVVMTEIKPTDQEEEIITDNFYFVSAIMALYDSFITSTVLCIV